MIKHDLKSIECTPSAGGCGLVFTLPPEHNKIHEEMRIHKRHVHGHRPDVIDKQTKDLRPMTDKEQDEHLLRVKDIVQKDFEAQKKLHPDNALTLKEEIVGNEIHHTFEMEPVHAKIDIKKKKFALIVTEDEDPKFADLDDMRVLCPKCGKECMRIVEDPPRQS